MTAHANSCQIAARRQGNEVMFEPPPLTTTPVWRLKVFHFQPSRHIPSHPLCTTQHSYHPHTPPSFDWLTNHPPTQMPPSDIHPTDMQPGPWLWPSSDHEALSRGHSKRHLQRLRRIFRAKRSRRLWIYWTPLFQLHGLYDIRITVTRYEYLVWHETWVLCSRGRTPISRLYIYTLACWYS
jgi:hypothetical protein